MTRMTPRLTVPALLLGFAWIAGSATIASAYGQYSGGGINSCAYCHGDFRSVSYTSLVDGLSWGNLHNLHRSSMLSNDCDACHLAEDTFPVVLSVSAGGAGLEPIGCMGCHGRNEDHNPANPNWPLGGRGAGLRQHHTNAGVQACLACHDDAAPAAFVAAGENVLPPYYANPGTGHASMPVSACNADGTEDFAGTTIGLDNDGDGVHDGSDTNCGLSGVNDTPDARALQVSNYPNPFNPMTVIRYELPAPGWARLQIHAATGELVCTLEARYHEQPGAYEARWDGRNGDGSPVASGVYFGRVSTAESSASARMVLLR